MLTKDLQMAVTDDLQQQTDKTHQNKFLGGFLKPSTSTSYPNFIAIQPLAYSHTRLHSLHNPSSLASKQDFEIFEIIPVGVRTRSVLYS